IIARMEKPQQGRERLLKRAVGAWDSAGVPPGPPGPGYDRGRDGALGCAAPPSEPDWRVSRIRLSSWWVALVIETDKGAHGHRTGRRARVRQRRCRASGGG